MANNLIKIYLLYTVDSGLNLCIATMKCYNNNKNVKTPAMGKDLDYHNWKEEDNRSNEF